MSLKIEVVGAVFEHDGAILACHRARGRVDAGLWEFPGGKVETGETPATALARELKEELGTHVRVGVLISRSETLSGGKVIDLATYFVHPTDGYPKDSSDHDELRWVKKSDLMSLEWALPDLPTVESLIRSAQDS